MPKSRGRFGRNRRPKRKFDIRTAVSKFFESIGLNPERDLKYPVLYHYTSTHAALKILESQKCWATAHDCTNDSGELITANATVFDVARAWRQNVTGLAARALDCFLRDYDLEAIAKIRTAYLACFSIARDDENQWRRYGGNGKGICLGVRVINEPGPESAQVFSRLFEVLYSERTMQTWFSDALGRTCLALAKYPSTTHNIRCTLASINGLAAFASITTKTPEWRSEQEVRHVTMDRFEAGISPNVRSLTDGRQIRYLPVSLRAEGKLIALDEIIIGADQELEEVRKQFEAVLIAKGYVEGSIEYPRFTVSSVSAPSGRNKLEANI
jgi:hypothetical protein